MSIEDILLALDEQCREECQEIFNKAQEEAKRILEKAQQEAEAIRKSRLAKAKADAEGESISILYSARLRSKNSAIRAREEMAERAMRRAEETLEGVRSRSDYPSMLGTFLEEALAHFEGNAVVHVDPRDEKAIRPLAGKSGNKYEIRTDIETLGGVIVSDQAEKVRIINTVEERLNRAREKLRMQVYGILFGEGNNDAAGGG